MAGQACMWASTRARNWPPLRHRALWYCKRARRGFESLHRMQVPHLGPKAPPPPPLSRTRATLPPCRCTLLPLAPAAGKALLGPGLLLSELRAGLLPVLGASEVSEACWVLPCSSPCPASAASAALLHGAADSLTHSRRCRACHSWVRRLVTRRRRPPLAASAALAGAGDPVQASVQGVQVVTSCCTCSAAVAGPLHWGSAEAVPPAAVYASGSCSAAWASGCCWGC